MYPGESPPEWNQRQLPPTNAYPASTPPYDTQRPPYDTQRPYPTSTPPYPIQPVYPQPYPPAVFIPIRSQPSSGLAIASMVLGILGLLSSCCTFGIFSLLAVIFGHVGLADTRDGAKGGRGMAVAGLVMGYVVFIPAIALSFLFVFGAGLAAIIPTITPMPTPTP